MSECNQGRAARRESLGRPFRRALIYLWLCFLLRAFFYCILFPIWEGYDEYSHFAYVQHLAVDGHIPAGIRTPVSKEVAESLQLVPLPWTLRELESPHVTHDTFWQLTDAERSERQKALFSIPPGLARVPASENLTIYEAQQPPLYYWLMCVPYRLISSWSLPARVLALRLLGAALASLMIPAVFLVSGRVLRGSRDTVALVALIVLMPELMISISRVGNEGPAIVLYSLLVWLSLKMVDGQSLRWIYLIAGAMAGLGLLTKAYFLTAIPALIVCAGTAVRAAKDGRRRLLLSAALSLAVAALISSWWYVRTWTLTGSLSGLMQAVDLRNVSVGELLRLIPQVEWLRALDSTFFSHIWFGNWSFLQLRWWMYHIFRYVVLVAGLGLLVLALRYRFRLTYAPFEPRHLVVLLAFYGFFWLGLAYHVLITYATSSSSSSAGWYLYCAVVAEVLLVTAGLYGIVPNRFRRWILPAGASAFALLDLYATHFVLIPYYAGVIRHQANGALATLHVPRLVDFGFAALVDRLLFNKPEFISSPLLVLAWVLYWASTVALVVVSFRCISVTGYSTPEFNSSDGSILCA